MRMYIQYSHYWKSWMSYSHCSWLSFAAIFALEWSCWKNDGVSLFTHSKTLGFGKIPRKQTLRRNSKAKLEYITLFQLILEFSSTYAHFIENKTLHSYCIPQGPFDAGLHPEYNSWDFNPKTINIPMDDDLSNR